MESSWVYDELEQVRNCHAAFHWGLLPGLAYAGLACHILRGKEPWTLSNEEVRVYELTRSIVKRSAATSL